MDGARNAMKYSPGVLIGNWYEDIRVCEDKVSLYRNKFDANSNKSAGDGPMLQKLMEETTLSELTDIVELGVPLQLVNVGTGATLALDTTPQLSPKPHQCLVTAAERGQPQVRSTWVLQRAKDENNAAYGKVLKEEKALHYGQHIRIANEDAHSNGFYYLHSELHGQGRSGMQQLTASLVTSKDNTFVVARPNEKREDIRDGGVVKIGDPVILYHAPTNQPVRCSRTLRKTSFGYEFELSCSFASKSFSRSISAVTAHPENTFVFAGAPSTMTNALRSRSVREDTMSMSMSLGCGVDTVIARIRDGALRYGGRLGFRLLSKAMGTACNEQRKTMVNRQHIYDNIRLMDVAIQPLELDVIFKRFDKSGNGVVVAQEFLREIRGDMPPSRIDAVVRAFQRLTIEGAGSVDFLDMLNIFKFNSTHHPDVEEGIISCEQAIFDFVNAWPGMNKTTTVTLEDFLAYYTDVSPAFEGDDRFITMMEQCWPIPATDEYKTRRPRRAVEVLHTNDSTETIYLPDSLVVNTLDSHAVRSILIQHGVKDIKEIQVTI